jgi:lipid II:glycine glycyltransferase (peptidoglycan interpeptide bridge formation enzyme)
VSAEHYRIEELTPEGFDRLIGLHPKNAVPLEQTPAWAEFERRTGRQPYGIFAYFDDGPRNQGARPGSNDGGAGDFRDGEEGPLVAIASYLHSTRRLRESMVVVNGPVWFADRTPRAEQRLLGTIRAQFRNDPDVTPVFARLQVQHSLPGVAKALEPGWYDREIVVDLSQDEKSMLAGFRPNARQAIRKAGRAGITVRVVERADRQELFRQKLFPILEETASRDGFSSFSSSYYETLLEALEDYTELLVAELEGVPISWLITTEYRGYAVYYFAASSAEARRTFAPYLLLWESFRMLKSRGNTSCGLTGIVSETYPSLANVTTFKRNFSKDVVVLPTTFDVPLRPGRYAALALALRVRRNGPPTVRQFASRMRSVAARTGSRRAKDAVHD